MYTYSLNIGLENNTLNRYQIEELINYIFNSNGRIYSRQNIGEYNGNPENTLILVIAGTTWDQHKVREFVQLLCTLLTQECIPVKSPGYKELIYNSNFEGEKFTFNDDYFIDY